ncbi:MAG: SH3 domain-containing protein, partial [Lachnospiraceae bacterium]|nr:SH3 domain-containing protein [Lachnospiraceae bacterium]
MKRTKGKLLLSVLLFSILLSGCGKIQKAMVDVPETSDLREETTVGDREKEPIKEEKDEVQAEVKEQEKEIQEAADTDKKETQEEQEEEPDSEEGQVVEMEEVGYTITQMEEISMYASSAVNVREGPSTDFERVGALRAGQEVKVTGEASTGWYEIAYGEAVGYVSDKYLQTEPVQQEIALTSNNAGNVDTTNVILIGDSRTAKMKNCAGENS